MPELGYAATPISDVRGYLPFAQVLAVLEAARENPRDYLLLMTLAFTGRRVSEVVGLSAVKEGGKWIYAGKEATRGGIKPEDILPERNAIVFSILKKRGGPIQKVKPVPARLKTLLCQYAAARSIPPGQRIFPISRARVDQIIKKYAAVVGITAVGRHQLHAHTFRHSFAIHLVDRLNLRKLQELLDHTTINMTANYLQYSTADIEQDLEEAFPA